jgi:plasmid stabilization system protein ParE
MPRLKWSQPAILDVPHLHDFLAPKSREAAVRAVIAIRHGVKALGEHPEIGRPMEELPSEFREWSLNSVNAPTSLCITTMGTDHDLGSRHGREVGY